MGKWCQQRKRGSSVGIHLPPPPRPVLEDLGTEVLQTATGLDDTGGTCGLETSDDDGLTWDFAGSPPWEDLFIWGASDDFAGLLLRCRETGNGITYSGHSPWSLVLDLS